MYSFSTYEHRKGIILGNVDTDQWINKFLLKDERHGNLNIMIYWLKYGVKIGNTRNIMLQTAYHYTNKVEEIIFV